jgi:hypothetical protein
MCVCVRLYVCVNVCVCIRQQLLCLNFVSFINIVAISVSPLLPIPTSPLPIPSFETSFHFIRSFVPFEKAPYLGEFGSLLNYAHRANAIALPHHSHYL